MSGFGRQSADVEDKLKSQDYKIFCLNVRHNITGMLYLQGAAKVGLDL